MLPMNAGILAVGSELLGTERLDTNSLLLTKALQQYGVEVLRKVVVRDVEREISEEIRRMAEELTLVLVTGGLGPTTDDRTRPAAAKALARPLARDEDLLQGLQAKFLQWGLTMPVSNSCQADVIEGAEVLVNPRGTAPGMKIEHRDCTVFLFPGVPSELEGLIRTGLEPWLASRTAGKKVETRILRIACMSESALEDSLGPAYEEFDSTSISILASPGDIQVHVTATGTLEERRSILDAMEQKVRELVGDSLYATGAKSSLEGRVAELLMASGETLATAESCTAGLLAERLTRIAGSSDYFLGGVVVYTNELKERLLGVSKESLVNHGAVSREVVVEMAEAVARRLESDFGVGISGIAGPDGGTEDKPVGTVHVAVSHLGDKTTHRELHLPGGRQRVRWLASQWALDTLRRRLL